VKRERERDGRESMYVDDTTDLEEREREEERGRESNV
jgi:hypothetical protein